MRYVLVIMTITLFILWESIYSDWTITRSFAGEVSRVWNRLGF